MAHLSKAETDLDKVQAEKIESKHFKQATVGAKLLQAIGKRLDGPASILESLVCIVGVYFFMIFIGSIMHASRVEYGIHPPRTLGHFLYVAFSFAQGAHSLVIIGAVPVILSLYVINKLPVHWPWKQILIIWALFLPFLSFAIDIAFRFRNALTYDLFCAAWSGAILWVTISALIAVGIRILLQYRNIGKP